MRSRPTAPIAPLAVVLGLAAGLALLLDLASCRATPPADPLGREPALLIEGPALLRFLDRASALVDTPAGRATAKLKSRLDGCAEVALTLPSSAADGAEAGRSGAAVAAPSAPASPASPASPLEALACRDARPIAPALAERLERARGEHAGILQWPIGGAGRIELRFDVDAHGGLRLDGRLEPDEGLGALAFLVPAAEPPAPARIDADRALVHLHLRSAAGTGLAALVPRDGQADRLFALKGRLLEGALLEGTLELAFVEPAPEGQVPLALLALHHRGAAPIEAALAEALAQLEATWSIVPSPRRFGGASGPSLDGGCYVDLPLLPELAPCWVVTPDALLVGYRAEAIEAALAPGDGAEAASPAGTPAVSAAPAPPRAGKAGAASSPTSGLVVDFERVRRLDRRLVAVQSEQAGAGPWPARLADLYARLELRGEAALDGAIALSGRLEARP